MTKYLAALLIVAATTASAQTPGKRFATCGLNAVIEQLAAQVGIGTNYARNSMRPGERRRAKKIYADLGQRIEGEVAQYGAQPVIAQYKDQISKSDDPAARAIAPCLDIFLR